MKHAKFGKCLSLTMALLMLSAVFGSENASAYGAVRQTAAVSSIPETLVPIGHTIGIKLFSDGVLVVGLSELESASPYLTSTRALTSCAAYRYPAWPG